MSGLKELFRLRRPPPSLLGKGLGAVCILLVLAGWYAITLGAAEERVVSPTVLPSPAEVAGSMRELFTERGLVESIAATLIRVLIGFGLAVLVGVPAGILAGSWQALRAFLAPIVLFGRNVPIAALIPLTVLAFGIDEKQKYAFIFIATVPLIFSDAAAAVIAIHDRYVETAETLGANHRQIIMKVLVPLALPDIYTSLRHLFGLAFGYIMLAELINAEHGLGHLISMSQRRGQNEHILMVLIIIGLLAYGIDRTLVFFQIGLFPHRKDLG